MDEWTAARERLIFAVLNVSHYRINTADVGCPVSFLCACLCCRFCFMLRQHQSSWEHAMSRTFTVSFTRDLDTLELCETLIVVAEAVFPTHWLGLLGAADCWL